MTQNRPTSAETSPHNDGIIIETHQRTQFNLITKTFESFQSLIFVYLTAQIYSIISKLPNFQTSPIKKPQHT